MASPSSHNATDARQGWLSVDGAAKYTSLSPELIRGALNSGDLPGRRTSGPTSPFRIKVSDLDAWMDAKPEAGA